MRKCYFVFFCFPFSKLIRAIHYLYLTIYRNTHFASDALKVGVNTKIVVLYAKFGLLS